MLRSSEAIEFDAAGAVYMLFLHCLAARRLWFWTGHGGFCDDLRGFACEFISGLCRVTFKAKSGYGSAQASLCFGLLASANHRHS